MTLKEIAEAYAKNELQDNHAPIEVIVAAAFLNGIDYAEHYPHWISVEEELPKENEWILAYMPTGAIKIDVVNYDSYGCVELCAITHWMHLPQSPKKGGEQ